MVYAAQKRTFTNDDNDDASEDSESVMHPPAVLEYIHLFPA